MPKTNEEQQVELLEQIRRLLILNLSHLGVQGKRIAEVIGVDGAIVSRILSPKKSRK
jgi:hypothetical protein